MAHSTTITSTGKRRPPQWTGETRDGQPLVRGILIAPPRRSDCWTVCIQCPYCGRRHTHGWPGGPDALRHQHRARHCIEIDSQPYLIGVDPTDEVVA